MKKIKHYLVLSFLVFTPALLLAHPGHEHHGTGLELFIHFLLTAILALGLGVGLFRLAQFVLRRKNSVTDNQIQP